MARICISERVGRQQAGSLDTATVQNPFAARADTPRRATIPGRCPKAHPDQFVASRDYNPPAGRDQPGPGALQCPGPARILCDRPMQETPTLSTTADNPAAGPAARPADAGPLLRVVRRPEARDLPLPAYMTPHASGLDLYAAVEQPVTIEPGRIVAVPTGLFVEIPPGYEGQVRARSGLALRHGLFLPNAPGTIDADYRGELKVIVSNCSREPFTITRGLRFAQLVIQKVERVRVVEVEQLSETARGEGGFGHTGSGHEPPGR